MKNITTGLQTFLNSANEAIVCDLLTFTLANGTVLYYTDADQDITFPVGSTIFSATGTGGKTIWPTPPALPVTFSSGGGNLVFNRSKTSAKIGTTVAEMDLTVSATSSALVSGTPFLQLCRNSGLDGAIVRVDRLFMSSWTNPIGICNNFLGRVSTVEATRLSAMIKVKALIVMLDLKLPKNMFQPGCLHSLYDSGCTMLRASFAFTSTVAASSTQMTINSTLSNPAGYFTQGYVLFTGGANNGERRDVLGFSGGTLTLALPLLNVPTVGDAFTAYAGCDHTSATCIGKFNNLANFRGYEFVPVSETAL
jgi:uncharacterized phage protein (TIGR02218 family)